MTNLNRTLIEIMGEKYEHRLEGGVRFVIRHDRADRQIRSMSVIAQYFERLNSLWGIPIRHTLPTLEFGVTACWMGIIRELIRIGKFEGDRFWFIPGRKYYLRGKLLRAFLRSPMLLLDELVNLYNFWTFLGELMGGLLKMGTPQQKLGNLATWQLWKRELLGLNLKNSL